MHIYIKKRKTFTKYKCVKDKNQNIDINQFNSVEKLIKDNNFEKLRLYKNSTNKEWTIIKEEDKIFYDRDRKLL